MINKRAMRELLVALMLEPSQNGRVVAQALGQPSKDWLHEVWRPLIEAGYLEHGKPWVITEAGKAFVREMSDD